MAVAVAVRQRGLSLGGITARAAALVPVAALVLYLPYSTDQHASQATNAVIFAIVGLSMNVLVGYTGQISLGQQAFVGLGALAAANFANSGINAADPFSFGMGMVAAAAISAAVALALGAVALRITGLYLALVTLVFGSVMADAVFTINSLNGRAAGEPAYRPTALTSNFRYYLFALAVLAVVIYVDVWITRSKVGRGLLATRDDELVAQAFGINPLGYKLLGFVISGAMAGLAGGLFAFWNQSFSDKDFTGAAGTNKALIFIVMVVVGGLGNRVGVIVASAFFALLDPLLIYLSESFGWSNYYIGHKFYFSSVIGAVLLLQTVIMNPGGLGQVLRPFTRWLGGGRFTFHDDAGGPAGSHGGGHVRA